MRRRLVILKDVSGYHQARGTELGNLDSGFQLGGFHSLFISAIDPRTFQVFFLTLFTYPGLSLGVE